MEENVSIYIGVMLDQRWNEKTMKKNEPEKIMYVYNNRLLWESK